jgi:Siderophore-interacting protein
MQARRSFRATWPHSRGRAPRPPRGARQADITSPLTLCASALPADTAATALLVTSHGAKSRPAPAGAPATSLLWLDRSEMLEMLSDLHPATGTAAYLFGERHVVRTAEELLVAGGLDRDAIASKPYWRRDQPTASRHSTDLRTTSERTPPVVAWRRLRAPASLPCGTRGACPLPRGDIQVGHRRNVPHRVAQLQQASRARISAS